MKLDLLIKNGRVADVESGAFVERSIGVVGDRIVDLTALGEFDAETTINADGALVLPGLIDFHAHVFHGGSAISVNPDVVCLPNGVTSVVDAGSSGWANYPSFYNGVITPSTVKIKSYLNVVNVGLATLGGGPTGYLENTNPANYNAERIKATFERYGDNLLGLKLRYSRDIAKDKNYSADPFHSTLALAKSLKVPLCVHVTDSLMGADELVHHFREGDVYAHCFHGTGNTILNPSGRLFDSVKEAKARGVIFDCSNGVAHFDFSVARAALAEGFMPDVISTDLTTKNSLRTNRVYSLPFVMSKYYAMGMPLMDIVRAVTQTPARLMRMAGEIGTLAPGANADIAIVKLRSEAVTFEDTRGESMTGEAYFDNCATVCNGQIVYRRYHF